MFEWIAEWVSNNKKWVFSGIGVTIGLVLGKILSFLFNIIKQRKSQIEFDVEREDTNFFRACVSANDSTDKDTIIRPAVAIQNKNPGYIIIKKYKLKVLCPWKYRAKSTQLIPSGEEVRYREGQGRPRLAIGYIPALDQEHKISAGETAKTPLFFRVSIIVDRATKELECKLKIKAQNGQKASCKFVAEKRGH